MRNWTKENEMIIVFFSVTGMLLSEAHTNMMMLMVSGVLAGKTTKEIC